MLGEIVAVGKGRRGASRSNLEGARRWVLPRRGPAPRLGRSYARGVSFSSGQRNYLRKCFLILRLSDQRCHPSKTTMKTPPASTIAIAANNKVSTKSVLPVLGIPHPKKPPVRPPGTNTGLTVSGGPCINSRPPRARLRRSGHRAYSLCRCLRGAGGGVDHHRGLPVSGIARRSPCRVDRIARRRLPCAKRASILSYAPQHQVEANSSAGKTLG